MFYVKTVSSVIDISEICRYRMLDILNHQFALIMEL